MAGPPIELVAVDEEMLVALVNAATSDAAADDAAAGGSGPRSYAG